MQEPPFLAQARAAGFEWLAFQMQNGANPIKDRDFTQAKQLGFKAGPWGVSYNQADLRRDMTSLVNVAKSKNSDFLVMNTEFSLDPTPLIEVGQQFVGPKALIVMTGNVFDIQAQKLTAAGWTIITEDYLNEQDNLTPATSREFMTRAGVPFEAQAHCFGMYEARRADGSRVRVSGARYCELSSEAGIKAAISLYMGESTLESDYRFFKDYIARQTVSDPTPVKTTVDATWAITKGAQDQMIAQWQADGLTPAQLRNQRIWMDRQLADKTQTWWKEKILPLL